MKRPTKWLKIDAVLGKPNSSAKCSMQILSIAELGRWVAKHLDQGYTVTLTKVEAAHATTKAQTQEATRRRAIRTAASN